MDFAWMSSSLSPESIAYLSGVAAGCADTLFNYPPYGLHYRLQRHENLFNPKIYTPRELYRGVGAYSAIIPITCICDGLTDSLENRGYSRHTAAIGSGMVAALLVSAPIGNAIVMNLRLKSEKKPAGTLAAVRQLRSQYGMKGFYTGVETLLLREAIYSWSVFYAKRAVQKKMKCGDIAASVLAGTVATILSQPCDTLATYSQNKVIRQPIATNLKEMWRINGVRTFYRGFVFRWYAVIAGIYVMDKVSTTVKDWLKAP